MALNWETIKLSVIGGAVLAVFAFLLIQHWELVDARATIKQQANTITTLKNNQLELESAIAKQNAGIAAAKQAATDRAHRGAAGVTAAHQSAVDHAARARALSEKSLTGDDCQASHTFLNEYFEGLQ